MRDLTTEWSAQVFHQRSFPDAYDPGMRRRREWWLSGRVVSTRLRRAGKGRWLVTVRFQGGALLCNWLASRESAQRQLAEAEQLPNHAARVLGALRALQRPSAGKGKG